MIRYFFVFLVIASISMQGNCQVSSSQISTNAPIAKVKDWDQNTIMFNQDYWSPIKNEIVKQIGEQEFEKVKANSGFRNIPKELSLWDGKVRKDIDTHYAKLNNLKLYKIATFTDMGSARKKVAILRCPYEENKLWDEKAVWDTIYFVMVEDALEK